MTFDDRLYGWDELVDGPWPALLIGNGASQVVWPRFGYRSLFQVASEELEPGLSDSDVAVFDDLAAESNFEKVLGSLRTAQVVNTALRLETVQVAESYESIRQALVEAVQAVHVPYGTVQKSTLRSLRNEMTNYDSVFTTNYDLLPYWSAMVDPLPGEQWNRRLVDFFWTADSVFDATNTDARDEATRLYNLHGGLQLRRNLTSTTTKVVARGDQSLLEVIATDDGDAWPLFVSEGSADAKLATIRSSDYLSFCYRALATCDEPLVVFGHRLGNEDDHLVKALDHAPDRRLAVSLHQPRNQIAEMHWLKSRLPKQDIRFFDAESHPLGDSALMADNTRTSEPPPRAS